MKTKMFLVMLAASAVGASAAAAQPAMARIGYQDAAGRTWTSVPSETGVVLTTRGTTVHLGRDCKAASSRYGLGRWETTGDGFAIVFATQRIAFAGPLDIGQAVTCRG